MTESNRGVSPGPESSLSIGVFILGDEILSGKREDRHFARVREILSSRGLGLSWVQYLGDDRRRCVDAFEIRWYITPSFPNIEVNCNFSRLLSGLTSFLAWLMLLLSCVSLDSQEAVWSLNFVPDCGSYSLSSSCGSVPSAPSSAVPLTL